MIPSARRLSGVVLDGGWRVVAPAPRLPTQTGGYFSVCYLIENQDGRKAFLKALDISRALQADDPALALKVLTEAFVFEREVLVRCKAERLDRVVTALAHGTVRFDNAPDGGVVQYLIFELAQGDIRAQASADQQFDLAWSLRALHHVATGLWQLHNHGIAHQDLKPSNVLVFEDKVSKIADLGRAAYRGHLPPHEACDIAGDLAYAPPELLYGSVDPDWNRRRFGCDAYLLGSLTTFFFLGASATPLLRKELPEPYCWGVWTGTYEAVLPYVRDAFGRVIETLTTALPAPLRGHVPLIVRQLCEPDPRLRGHPKNRNTPNQYSMERYVSAFNLLAQRAELGFFTEART